MDNYCLRQDAEYNRCYCSSQLAQIDAKHKPKIDQLIKEILTLQSTNYWTDEEMHEYWEDTYPLFVSLWMVTLMGTFLSADMPISYFSVCIQAILLALADRYISTDNLE